MLDKFWQLQKLINQATDQQNEKLIEKYGDEQDECVKQMTKEEFEKILNENLPTAYKDYIKKLRE